MPLPEYRYGKVTGTPVDLTVVSERGESPMVCCGYCSAQMAALTAKAGVSTRMVNEAHAMRKAGGRPHNAGNTASELRAGAKSIGVTLQDVDIANIPARLRAGYAITAGVQYGQLPAWLKVQTNDFGHAVCLYGWDELEDLVGFFDPLWTQGARGAWVSWGTVTNALWPNKNHSTTTVKLVTGGEMAGIYYNPSRWKATADIPVYLDPSWGTKVTTIKAGGLFTSLGPKAVVDADGKDASARTILVTTGGLIPGDQPGVKAILWVKGADFKATDQGAANAWDDSIWSLALQPDGRYPCPPPLPVEPIPPVDTDAIIAERDAEWEEALKNGEPWPST